MTTAESCHCTGCAKCQHRTDRTITVGVQSFMIRITYARSVISKRLTCSELEPNRDMGNFKTNDRLRKRMKVTHTEQKQPRLTRASRGISTGCLPVPLTDLRGDPRRLRRAEFAHRPISGAPFWNSLSHGCANRDSSVSSSFPPRLSRADSSPLRSCSLKREGIPARDITSELGGIIIDSSLDARTIETNRAILLEEGTSKLGTII
jgi:hypothetical protein